MNKEYLPRCYCAARCGSTFITVTGFQQHMRLHHGQWEWKAQQIRRYAHIAENQVFLA